MFWGPFEVRLKSGEQTMYNVGNAAEPPAVSRDSAATPATFFVLPPTHLISCGEVLARSSGLDPSSLMVELYIVFISCTKSLRKAGMASRNSSFVLMEEVGRTIIC